MPLDLCSVSRKVNTDKDNCLLEVPPPKKQKPNGILNNENIDDNNIFNGNNPTTIPLFNKSNNTKG